MSVYRPIRAHVDLAALRHNHAVARRHAGNARIWSVVKADAYGHGLLRVAQALNPVTDGFALVELEGAIALRRAGVEKPILMLEGCYAAAELPVFAEYRLTPVLHRLDQVGWIEAAGLAPQLPVYLKLNTGMNRLGLDVAEFRLAVERLRQSGVADVTLMTHFSDADEARGVAEQMARLQAMRGGLAYPLCLANSAALLRFPEAVGDWVRPGIMLYGSSPFPERTAAALDLAPVMTLESEVIAVRDLQPGDRVGYGGSFTASSAMRIGVVACGYGDGYPRHAPSGTPVLVAGRRSHTLGRVSMDKLCVDLSDLPQAGAGAPVVMWGRGLPADEVAACAGTISYELFCALAQRVPVLEEDLGQG
ncbi:MAG: alanine racemase [Rhodocyclales bacterium]|nr:alanine racemase [Rhodocyclales bacterium]